MEDTKKVSSEWKEIKLREVANYINKKVATELLTIKNYISTENLLPNIGGIIESSKLPTANKVNGFKEADILFSNIRTYFKKIWLADTFGGASNDVLIIRSNNPEIITNEYLYYCLAQDDFFDYTVQTSKGTKMPRGDKEAIMNYTLRFPMDLNKQKEIANTFIVLDDKIKLNNQMNQTLEEMAQAIFKEWFVEFNFPITPNFGSSPLDKGEGGKIFGYKDNGGEMEESELGEIPKGWRVEEFYKIAEFVNGKVFKEKDYCEINKKLPIVKIAELKSGITSQTRYSVEDVPEKYFLNNSDILFSWSGNPETSLDAFIWTMGKAVLNQHIFKVDKKNISKGLIYTILKYHMKFFKEMARNKQTTGLGHVTVKNLKEYKIPIPNDDVLEKIEDVFKGYFEKILSIHLENQTLINTRDTLLPKLMSGKVRV